MLDAATRRDADCAPALRGQGLNDEGDGEIQTVAKGVQAFRESQTITALSESDLSYRKMVKQIDKYWEQTLCRLPLPFIHPLAG